LERAKEQLFKRRNFGAFLSFNEWNMRYVSSTYTPFWTTPGSGLRYLLLPRTSDSPIIYEQGDIGYHTKKLSPWIEDKNVKVAISGVLGWTSWVMGPEAQQLQLKKFVNQIVNDLKEHGVHKEPLATDFYDPLVFDALKKAGIPEVTSDGFNALIEARKIKLPEEIACINMQCRIAEAAFQRITEILKPGISEVEIMAELMKTVYSMGGEVSIPGVFVSSGPFTYPNLRHFTGRRIAPGDTLICDMYNSSFNGYKVCYYRTFSLGRPPKSIEEIYREHVEWLYDAIKSLKPGITTAEIASKWPEASKIESWKIIGVDNEDAAAANNWGHGIGLTLYEPPIIWRGTSLDAPQRIEAWQTLALETQHYDPNTGMGVRTEEVVVVTDSGYEVLSKWPIDEITVC